MLVVFVYGEFVLVQKPDAYCWMKVVIKCFHCTTEPLCHTGTIGLLIFSVGLQF